MQYDKKPQNRSNTYHMSRGGITMDSGSDNVFNTVELTRPNSSWFDLSHAHTTTGNMGKLIPIMTMECYPGDRIKVGNELLIRLQPMIVPPMQRFDAYIHNFFIPFRILMEQDKFEEFMRGENVALPYLTMNAARTTMGSVPDYMRIPKLTGANTRKINALYLAGYQRTFFEYYRNQNLSAMTDNDKPYALAGDNEAQAAMLLTLRKRSYAADYFTSALPFTQKGAASTISFNFADVPVSANADDFPTDAFLTTGIAPSAGVTGDVSGAHANLAIFAVEAPSSGTTPIFAKTSLLSGTSFTINDFRLALAQQHWLERMAVGGTRMTELIRAHFGVTSSDQRLARPEYIGGMRTPVVISEVLQTSESGTTPQGNMSGHGISASFSQQDDTYECEEWGMIISILSVMPVATYATGLPRHLDWAARNTREEWYWPEFAQLGEQAIHNVEIFADTIAVDQDGDWGYTARFNELRFIPSAVSGEIKTNLAEYTASRLFTTLPTLNEAFITNILEDTEKIFSVTPTEDSHELIISAMFNMSANRLLPKYAQPELQG